MLPVLFFKRILKFKHDALAKLRDKRKAERFSVGPNFTLKGSVNLVGVDNQGNLLVPKDGTGRGWGGHLANISSSGVSLLLPSAAATARGEKTILTLTLESHEVKIDCVVAHFRVLSSYAVCGLELQFTDFVPQKSFLQLLEAVAIGASLAPVESGQGKRHATGLSSDLFRATGKAELYIFRDTSSKAIERFDLVIGEHCLRGEAKTRELSVYPRGAAAKPFKSGPTTPAAPEVYEEMRRLFRWIAPNLTKVVPSDVRAFLKQFADQRTTSRPTVDSKAAAWRPPTNPARTGGSAPQMR